MFRDSGHSVGEPIGKNAPEEGAAKRFPFATLQCVPARGRSSRKNESDSMTCRKSRPRRIGYARVSTEEQVLDLQLDALEAAGCDLVYKDEGVSAVAPVRAGFEQALHALKPGDTLVIWKLDRAYRSTLDAILALKELQAQNIQFRCLTMHIDTSTPEGRKWFRDTASWAEYERELISERTKAGMEAARRRGKHIGRPRALSDDQIVAAHARTRQGASLAQLARDLGVAQSTLSRALSRLGGS